MRSRWFRRGLVLIGLLAAAVALRYTVFQPEPVPVTVYRVASGRVEDTVTNSKAGTVRSRRRAALSPEIGGRVVRLPVSEGARVKAGDVLMELASDDYRAQLELQRRSLDAATAAQQEACENARLAERDLDRIRNLAASELVSQQMLDQAQGVRDAAAAACRAARARAGQAQAAIDLASVNLQKTILRAPFPAVVAEISTEVGEWITPAPPGVPIPPVIELIAPEAIYISAPLDEVDVGKVQVGLPVRVTLDAYPGRSFEGRVVRIAPYVQSTQEQSRTFEIEVELDDQSMGSTLLPGTSADVEVILAARENVLRIPSYALIQGDRVMLVEDGRLVSRNVEPGLQNWEFTEIREGLAAGDLVVVSLDRPEVQAGALVEIEQETDR